MTHGSGQQKAKNHGDTWKKTTSKEIKPNRDLDKRKHSSGSQEEELAPGDHRDVRRKQGRKHDEPEELKQLRARVCHTPSLPCPQESEDSIVWISFFLQFLKSDTTLRTALFEFRRICNSNNLLFFFQTLTTVFIQWVDVRLA